MSAVSIAGSKIPLPEFNAGDQRPPESGVPPNNKKRSTAESLSHKAIELLSPALEA